MKNNIKKILISAIDIERWEEKSDLTYSFIDVDEREEMVENILQYLEENNYKIIKTK
jgi:hypothetical protein